MKSFCAFVFIVQIGICFCQSWDLERIQNDIKIKRRTFTAHYDKMDKIAINKYDSLIYLRDTQQNQFKKLRDSLKICIVKNESILEKNREKLNNFYKLEKLLSQRNVLLVKNPKHFKGYLKFASVDYPTKLIFKDYYRSNFYQLISIDSNKNYRVQIDEITNSKAMDKFYNKLLKNTFTINVNDEILFSLTGSSNVFQVNKFVEKQKKELELLEYNYNVNINVLNNKINDCSPLYIKRNREFDSLKLQELFTYYFTTFPNNLTEYNQNLEREKKNDIENARNYQIALASYEENNQYMIKNIEAEADKCFDWLKTEFKDPYSAVFEKYGVVTSLTSVKEKFPCVKVYRLTTRAKNSWGAYVPGKYLVAMKDGIPIAAAEDSGNNSTNDLNLYLNIFLLETVSCENSIIAKPEQPILADQRVVKPTMNIYNFNFRNY